MESYPGLKSKPSKSKTSSHTAKRQSTIDNLTALELHKLLEQNAKLIMGMVRGRLLARGIEPTSAELLQGIFNTIDKIA
jgi:hypothetical protein